MKLNTERTMSQARVTARVTARVRGPVRGPVRGLWPAKGERIDETITQSWNRLRRQWAEFREAVTLASGETNPQSKIQNRILPLSPYSLSPYPEGITNVTP